MDLRKPVLAGAAAGLAVDALMLLRGGPTDAIAYVVLPLTMSTMLVLLALNGARPVRGFVAGLREALGHVEAEERSNWVGGLEATVRTAQGAWHLETWNGGTVQLWVTPPGAAEPLLFQRRYRDEGRRAGERARVGQALAEEA